MTDQGAAGSWLEYLTPITQAEEYAFLALALTAVPVSGVLRSLRPPPVLPEHGCCQEREGSALVEQAFPLLDDVLDVLAVSVGVPLVAVRGERRIAGPDLLLDVASDRGQAHHG